LQKSDHFDGVRFFNPTGANGQPFSKVPKLFLTPQARWPSHVHVQPRPAPPLADAAVVVTFIGHSTWLIQTRAGNLLTDPMYSRCAGPFNRFGPRRVRDPGVLFDDLPPISIVLLSHNHYDHCDLATLRRLARRFDPVVVTPLGNGRLVRSAGIRRPGRVVELDWWDEADVAGLPIMLTPAQHFSARTPFDRNRALWSGFMITVDHEAALEREASARRVPTRLYFAGDTAYGTFFREIARRLGPIDLAFLPIGAYEPRWFMRAVHMNPEEAVQAHLDLQPARSVAMHFGTIQLTLEGIDEPLRALEAALRAKSIPAERFQALPFGDSIRVGERD